MGILVFDSEEAVASHLGKRSVIGLAVKHAGLVASLLVFGQPNAQDQPS